MPPAGWSAGQGLTLQQVAEGGRGANAGDGGETGYLEKFSSAVVH
jgi:hypothetical protein